MSEQTTEQEAQPDDGSQSASNEGRREGDPTELGFAAGDLGRIQGILLGDHARRIDERFNEHEALLGQKVQQVLADLENSNQSLRSEIEVLKSELAEERAARLESARLATHERASLSTELDGQRDRADEDRANSSAAVAELRADAIAQVDDLGSRVDDEVAKVNERLDGSAVDREVLSRILRDAADRVDDHLANPDPE